MAEKITVPTLGESVTEATVSKWLKAQGENVVVDEPIVELETDKVNVEVPAPSNGVLDTISVKEGETVNVGSLLGTVKSSSNQVQKNIKEVKNYSPPKKEKVNTEEYIVKNSSSIDWIILNTILNESWGSFSFLGFEFSGSNNLLSVIGTSGALILITKWFLTLNII